MLTFPDIQPVPGWFSPEHAAFFQMAMPMVGVRRMIELGTFCGRGTVFLASLLPPGGHLWTVDTFAGSHEHQGIGIANLLGGMEQVARHNLEGYGVADRVTVVVSDTQTADVPISVDMVYIDASHETADVEADIRRYWPRVRLGGLLCGDDWAWRSVRTAVCRTLLPVPFQVDGQIWYAERTNDDIG